MPSESAAGMPKQAVLEHSPSLDGLRGFALLVVILHHAAAKTILPNDNYIATFLTQIRPPLWFGLDLFFVLSGFLITSILLTTRESKYYFTSFYARRFLRVLPLYYGFLLVVCVILPRFGFDPAPFTREHQLWFWLHGQNLLGVRSIGPEGSTQIEGIVAHLWSLAVEEQFYFCWPLIVYVIPLRYLRFFLYAVIVQGFVARYAMARLGYSHLQIYMFTLCRFDGISLGCLIALTRFYPVGIVARVLRWADSIPGFWPLAAGFSLGILLAGNWHWFGWRPMEIGLYYFIMPLCCASLVYTCISEQLREGHVMRRIFSVKILRLFGRYSFAIYIFHVIVQDAIFETYFQSGWAWRWLPLYSRLGLLYYFVFSTAVVFSIGYLSWTLFEGPILSLKRYFNYRDLKGKPKAEVAAATAEPMPVP